MGEINLSFKEDYLKMRTQNSLNKSLFIFAHQMGERNFYHNYKTVSKSQWEPYNIQKGRQEKELRSMMDFIYKNVPYYRKIFKHIGLQPSDIKRIEDLEKFPILNKNDIKNNWEDFKPINLSSMKYLTISTSGSTGAILRHRISNYDRFLSGAMLYRGWGYAGYELGDKMVYLAGSALNLGSNLGVKSHFVAKANEITRNIRKLSTFDMNTEDMLYYAKFVNSFKPKFIRGYASSVNFFAKFIANNEVDLVTPKAVFTTAEKLMPHMRKNIEESFGCEVYDNYGLNDGGVGAYECPEHDGMHIDTERSIMEIVDDSGLQLESGVGRILATSLYNYAMPFIRYDTGDMGHIVSDICACGRESRLLREVIGRSIDVLLTPDGKYVNGHYLLFILEGIKGIKEYQILQKKIDNLTIKIVPDKEFNEAQLDIIKEIIRKKYSNWDIEFRCVDKITKTASGKYKYVINQCN